jgi:hypothetical protein
MDILFLPRDTVNHDQIAHEGSPADRPCSFLRQEEQRLFANLGFVDSPARYFLKRSASLVLVLRVLVLRCWSCGRWKR